MAQPKPQTMTSLGSGEPVLEQIVVANPDSVGPITPVSLNESNSPLDRDVCPPKSRTATSTHLQRAKLSQTIKSSTATTPTFRNRVSQVGKLVELCERCQGLDEAQLKPQNCLECVYAPDHGGKSGPLNLHKGTPSKTVRSSKVTGRWCNECTKRKSEPGEHNRIRRNAKWACKECAKLREEAKLSRARRHAGIVARQAQPKPGNSQPAPEKALSVPHVWQVQNDGETAQSVRRKRWQLATKPKPQREQDHGFEPATESDDPENPPKTNASNPLVDTFGTLEVYSESVNQIQANCRQWTAPTPVAAGPVPDFYDEQGQPVYLNNALPQAPAAPLAPHQIPVLSGPWSSQGCPAGTVNPAHIMKNPSSVADEPYQLSHLEDRTQSVWYPSPMDDFPLPMAPENGADPQQRLESGHHPGTFSVFEPLSVDIFRSRGHSDYSRRYKYPDPMALGLPEMPHSFDEAMDDIEFSNDCEALPPMSPPFSGAPSMQDALQADGFFPDIFQDLSPAPEGADQEPAGPSGPLGLDHGPQPWPIDPRLSAAPY